MGDNRHTARGRGFASHSWSKVPRTLPWVRSDINAATHNHQAQPLRALYGAPDAEHPGGTNRVAARGSAALPTGAGRCWCSQAPACGAWQPLRPPPFVAVARAPMHRPDAEAALGAFDYRERQDDVASSGVAAPQGRCGASSPPPPHRTRLTWLGSHRAQATPA
jgi:hypothetical protein